MNDALYEHVRMLLHTVDWDEDASDTEIMNAIDWRGLRAAFARATVNPDTYCPDCNGTGEPLPDGADHEEYSRCGNCKGWTHEG
jgi:hypothetical protein